MDICKGCGEHVELMPQHQSKSHVWSRCPKCYKMNVRRVQEARGRVYYSGGAISLTVVQCHGTIDPLNKPLDCIVSMPMPRAD